MLFAIIWDKLQVSCIISFTNVSESQYSTDFISLPNDYLITGKEIIEMALEKPSIPVQRTTGAKTCIEPKEEGKH